jgi:arylsulfatase A-like enzyme
MSIVHRSGWNRFVVAAWLLLCLAQTGAVGAATAAITKPNIIFILTDDLGYGDLGAFFQNARQKAGDKTKPWHFTPQLDKMAAEGIRLTAHYCAAPVCAPSRASLYLGVHQGHANVRDNQFDKALENNHTIGTVLKAAGYRTALIGKWGLQGKGTNPASWPAYPTRRGFDYYFGYVRHADGHEHYPKEGLYRGPKEVWDNDKEVSATLDKCYTADLFTARAKKWIIDQHEQKPAQPFMLFLTLDTPHAVDEYPTGPYPQGAGVKGGLQWLGKPGQMINTATGKVDSWCHPDYATATWDDDGDAKTPPVAWPEVYKRYATAVRRIDDCVADVLQVLRDLKLDTNTLVVFSSDNGPSIESYLKQSLAANFFDSFGPFDGIKRDLWEGGFRVPTIAWWPGQIPGGRVSDEPSAQYDWLATFAEIAGVPKPARSDGASLLPVVTGKGKAQPHVIYSEYYQDGKTPSYRQFAEQRRGRTREQMQAIRMGHYQGVRYNIKAQSDDFEIYQVAADPAERKNLAKTSEGTGLQQQMKNAVLAMRRPDSSAKRPYDNELVPSVTVTKTTPGVHFTAYKGKFDWVPDFPALWAVSGEGKAPVPEASAKAMQEDGGLLYTGYLEVPADGEYTLSVQTDTRALLRVHEATVIDADFDYQAGTEKSGSVRLQKGKHPLRLYYTHANGRQPLLKFSWSAPGIEKTEIPATAFSSSTEPRAQ